MNEEWKEFKGKYLISNTGKIISKKTGRELSCSLVASGYKQFAVIENGTYKRYTLHHVVAELFLPNPLNLNTVRFIDGDQLNCSVDNLEWISREEAHRISRGSYNV